MKNNTPLLVIFLAMICSFASCKKSKGLNTAAIKIATIDYRHNNELEHYSITYDAYNNVDTMRITGGGSALGHNAFKAFAYIGSSYSITDETGYTFPVYANTAGMILSIVQSADSMSFVYNGTQLATLYDVSPILNPPYYVLSSTQYTWSGGDVASIYTNSINETYDYDKSKSGQAGDIIRINQFLGLGLSYTKTSHLPIDMYISGTWAEKYYYQFDSQGRISQMQKVTNIAPATDTAIYQYTYY